MTFLYSKVFGAFEFLNRYNDFNVRSYNEGKRTFFWGHQH